MGLKSSNRLPPAACSKRFVALDLTTCWTSGAMSVGEDVLPDEGLWVQGNYGGAIEEFDGAVRYDGVVDCGVTCGAYGLSAAGARFVCNLAGVGPTEGCDLTNDGAYGDANCGWMVRDFVALTENGNLEDCTRSTIEDCVYSACDEGVTYHSVQCQCR